MTIEQATALAELMRATGNGLELSASVDESITSTMQGDRTDHRLTFTGGRWGAHSIDVSVSSVPRALAHWRGYCESNGVAFAVK